MLKKKIYTLIKNVLRNSNMTSGINACQSIRNKGTSHALEAQFPSSAISFQFSIYSTCLSLFCFVYVHMNCLGSWILIPFSKSVTMSKNAHLLFAIASNSHLSISITLHCVSTITYTFVDCCTSTCNSVNSYTSTSTTFSSPISFCIAYASTKCCSIASSSKGMASSNLRCDIFNCNGVFFVWRWGFCFSSPADALSLYAM